MDLCDELTEIQARLRRRDIFSKLFCYEIQGFYLRPDEKRQDRPYAKRPNKFPNFSNTEFVFNNPYDTLLIETRINEDLYWVRFGFNSEAESKRFNSLTFPILTEDVYSYQGNLFVPLDKPFKDLIFVVESVNKDTID